MPKNNKQNIQGNARVSSGWFIDVPSESIERAACFINWSKKQTLSIVRQPKKYRILYESIGSY